MFYVSSVSDYAMLLNRPFLESELQVVTPDSLHYRQVFLLRQGILR